ncbi:MAG TPA: hypothetical protein VFY40_14400, partial [Blastocatellia bacterium]|nr:hypothetical protein [Blastocatellia bacterium]
NGRNAAFSLDLSLSLFSLCLCVSVANPIHAFENGCNIKRTKSLLRDIIAANAQVYCRHWMEFAPYQMAHTPLKMTSSQAQTEVRQAWLKPWRERASVPASVVEDR